MTTTLAGLAFTANARTFADTIGWVAKHLPHKPTHPITAGILLTVADGQVNASAFDYDTAVTATLGIDSDTAGRVLVPGKFLADVTKTFPDKPVTVTTTDTTMVVTCGTAKLTLPLMVVEDYPALPATPPTVGTIAAVDLAALIARVGVAADVAGNKGLEFLRGIHLTFGDTLEATASDRYRAAVGVATWQPVAGGAETALVPAGMLIDAAKTLDGAGNVTVSCDANLLGLAADGRHVTTRLMNNQFPIHATRTFFPGRSEHPATVPTRDLIAALKRADLVRADKTAPVVLEFHGGGDVVTVGAHSGGTAAVTDEQVACDYDGDPVTVRFNPLYLADALTALRSERAELHITHEYRPVQVTSPDDADLAYQHTVVPIRSLS
ncbi:DNA polymerase III subunit beta [Micromonospora orduensis]|uniref:DNA polymerase III subunit beta n=1 Tax=Micromonospora orduensis TaxID=1420891 RepID=UPI0033ECF1BA